MFLWEGKNEKGPYNIRQLLLYTHHILASARFRPIQTRPGVSTGQKKGNSSDMPVIRVASCITTAETQEPEHCTSKETREVETEKKRKVTEDNCRGVHQDNMLL